jgi:hypothetical protein
VPILSYFVPGSKRENAAPLLTVTAATGMNSYGGDAARLRPRKANILSPFFQGVILSGLLTQGGARFTSRALGYFLSDL